MEEIASFDGARGDGEVVKQKTPATTSGCLNGQTCASKSQEDEEIPPRSVSRLKAPKDGQYSDPVFKKISVLNGEINKMSREQLQERLTQLKLDTRGVNDVLKKRLKAHYKKRKLMRAHIQPSHSAPKYDYLLVIDYEATCEQDNVNYPHEIIEFPIVMVDAQKIQVVDEFHSFCRPSINPQLSEFCMELTGITQEDVDRADLFPVVLQRAEQWMDQHRLGKEHKFVIVTDGPWDMSRFLCTQCKQNQIPFPKWGKKWINLRKAYGNFYHCQRKKLEDMLIFLGMKFEGNQHCGLHDSRNIARIIIRMIHDGWTIKFNEFLHESKSEQVTGNGASCPDQLEGDEDETESLQYNDRKDKESKRGSGVTTKSELTEAMTKMTLTEDNSDGSTENIDDLLHYYHLQKS